MVLLRIICHMLLELATFNHISLRQFHRVLGEIILCFLLKDTVYFLYRIAIAITRGAKSNNPDTIYDELSDGYSYYHFVSVLLGNTKEFLH